MNKDNSGVLGLGATDIVGNDYQTVIIGTQEWFAEDLRTSSYKNGDPIGIAQEAIKWQSANEGYYCFYDNNPENNIPYGKLYNFHAVEDPRCLCPEGWKVPSIQELDVLAEYLGGTTTAGAYLKETGTDHWYAPNKDANNSTGFSGIAGGGRGSVGEWVSFGTFGRYWSATKIDEYNALGKTLIFDQTWFNTNQFNVHFGFSVRCLKE